MNAPVKEEQLSETGWSLDADPPESVNNEPINDRLGLDDTGLPQINNTNNPSSNINNKLNNSRTSNQSGSFLPSTNNSNSNSINKLGNSAASKSINQTISANNNDLISLNDDQVIKEKFLLLL